MNPLKKKIAGVVLAAGTGSRMGGVTKQTLPFGQTTILGRVIQNALASELDEIIVVLGYCSDKIEQTIDFSGTRTIINRQHSKGQALSLRTGVGEVSTHCDGAMFLLGDQPLVNADIINLLVHAFENTDSSIVIPCFKGQRGNPVIIARSLFYRLNSLSGDVGAKLLFDEFPESVLKVCVASDAILVDVDTLGDYQALKDSRP